MSSNEEVRDCVSSSFSSSAFYWHSKKRLVALHSTLILGSRGGGQEAAQCNLSTHRIDKVVFKINQPTSRNPYKTLPC